MCKNHVQDLKCHTTGSAYCLKGNKIFPAGGESPAEVGEEEGPGSEAIFLLRWGCKVAVT